MEFLLLANEWTLFFYSIAFFAFYYYYTTTFDYFEKRGIPYMKPVILVGNFGARIIATRSVCEYQMDLYKYFKGERFGGIFEGRQPILHIFDSDLIKAVMIRDFDHFTDRNFKNSEEPRYLSRSLINLKGGEWKGLRSTMTPVFSSHRLKSMMPLLQLCAKQMVHYFENYDGKEFQMKEAMGRFTLETIGACAFGIKCDALDDKESYFIRVAEKFDYMPTSKRLYKIFIYLFYTCTLRLQDFFNLKYTDELIRILQAAKAERRQTDSKKTDFLQILVDLMNKENSECKGKSLPEGFIIDDDTIDAQCLLFLIGGYETTATLLSFATHVLATRPDLQEKLRAHINDTMQGMEMSYEKLSELTYLDAFLKETLRLYPPIPGMDRVVTKPYQIPDTTITLSPGDVVYIPLYAIHMDPKYFKDPTEFRPERFIGEENKKRPSHLFLTFGAGPRNCIGRRFAMITAKVAIVALMRNFKLSPGQKTECPVTLDKTSSMLKAKGGIWVRVQNLK